MPSVGNKLVTKAERAVHRKASGQSGRKVHCPNPLWYFLVFPPSPLRPQAMHHRPWPCTRCLPFGHDSHLHQGQKSSPSEHARTHMGLAFVFCRLYLAAAFLHNFNPQFPLHWHELGSKPVSLLQARMPGSSARGSVATADGTSTSVFWVKRRRFARSAVLNPAWPEAVLPETAWLEAGCPGSGSATSWL